MSTATALFEPSPEQATRLRRWRVSTFWVMLLGYVGYYIVRGNFSVAMPLLSQRFGYTNTELGTILTFSELAYSLGKLTTGPLADQVGGKRIFMIGMVGAVAFNFVFPLHSGLLYFGVIWCLARYFLSMGWGGIAKTIGEWYEPERNGVIMGVISINFQIGAVVASLIGGLLISLGSDWKGLFIWPAALVSVVAVGSHLASRGSPQDVVPGARFGRNAGKLKAQLTFETEGRKHGAGEIMRQLFRVPLFRQLLVFSFVIHVLRSFFMFWIPKFMVDMGMGNVGAALTSAVFPFAGCVGTIALGWYTDKYSKGGDRTSAMWKMLAGLVVAVGIIAVLIPFRLRFQTEIVLLLGVAGLCLYGPYSMSAGCISLDIAGSEGAGTCTGLLDGIGYIGGAVAAWGTGFVADRFGWQEVFFSLTALGVGVLGWVYYMSVSERRRV